MAKQIINIGASANDGSGDPIRNAFDKTNDNFNELYFALGSATNATSMFNAQGELDFPGASHKISFYYDTIADLEAVDASTYHGAIGHAHDTGKLYYAHNGAWQQLANYSDISGISVTSAFTTISVSGQNDIEADSADDTLTFIAGTGIQITTSDTNDSITITATGGGGSGSSSFVGLSDTPVTLGSALQYARVNSAGNALEFATLPTMYSNSDVDAHLNQSNPTSGYVLSWNGSDYAWVAQSGGSGGSVAMTDITDTTITNPQSGDILSYFPNDSTWRNVTFTPSFADIDQQPADSADKALFENSFRNAATVLTVSANGTSAYRFDQYGTTDNPTIYVKAGTTVGFDMSFDSGGTHPLKIQTSGGADYNTGLVALQEGNIYEEANAQGTYSGTLFWKIPASISGNYKYQCASHSGMTGTIVVEAAAGGGGGGGSSATRNTETETTASIADGAAGNVAFADIGKSYVLYEVTTDKAAWVRIYDEVASRTADASRTQGQDPAEGSGVIAEFITGGATTVKVTPGVFGWVGNSESTVPVSVTNLSGSTGTVQVDITALTLET